jgi:hypothetical protein
LLETSTTLVIQPKMFLEIDMVRKLFLVYFGFNKKSHCDNLQALSPDGLISNAEKSVGSKNVLNLWKAAASGAI